MQPARPGRKRNKRDPKRKVGKVHRLKQNIRDKRKYERKRELEERWGKRRRGGLNEAEGGGVHHSVAMTGWYLHLPVICTGFCRVEEEGKRRRRCKRGGEGKPLSSLSLSLISGSSGACFPRVPHFQISYLGPRFKYRSFIFLHVICMQLIKPGSLYFFLLFPPASRRCTPIWAQGNKLSLCCWAIAMYCIDDICTSWEEYTV